MDERQVLEFEKPIAELQKKISDMKDFAAGANLEMSDEIKSLEKKAARMRHEIFSNLTRWQKVQLAKHPRRPHTLDYIKLMTTDFIELHGDRGYADDKALVGGFAKIDEHPVMIIGQQKGRDTKQNLYRNFGMMHPEGYRKALRLFKLAEKFRRPVIVLIDTPGAYPGIGAEERGQAEAIARNIREMSVLKVPVIIVIIGEGASGGALGIGVGDRIYMLQYAWYSVISPEGCAAILWRDAAHAPQAAEALKLTAYDNMEMEIIDKILEEPPGGAHNDPELMARRIKEEILGTLDELMPLSIEDLLKRRLEKFRRMGIYKG